MGKVLIAFSRGLGDKSTKRPFDLARLEIPRYEPDRALIKSSQALAYRQKLHKSNPCVLNDGSRQTLETNKLETNKLETNKLETNKLETNKLETNKLETNKLETSKSAYRFVASSLKD
jgi:hypothetical protein